MKRRGPDIVKEASAEGRRLHRPLLAVCLAAIGLLYSLTEALAGRRVALVIGNSAYQATTRLANPLNDARAMRQLFKKLEFEVIYGEDLNKRDMEQKVAGFAQAANEAEVAIVYYAGHGATFEDRPYLVPVDAQFKNLESVPYELMPLETVLGELRRAKGLRVALVDACRDNEAELALKRRATRSLGVTRGLARPQTPSGLIVAYATQYMTTAFDGADGTNSPFTSALIKHLPTPGQDINVTMRYIGREVLDITGGQQVPAIDSSYFHDYFLVPKPRESATLAPPSVTVPVVDRIVPAPNTIQPMRDPAPPPAPASPPVDASALARTCDDRAGAPEDPDRNPASPGVAFASLDGRAALAACRVAVDANPTNRRLLFQYGRAWQAAKDFGQAKTYYEKAGDLGSAASYNNIGILHKNGHGVPRNAALATANYAKSARLGYAVAMASLGSAYGSGDGVAQDRGQAFRWYLKSAQLGHARGMALLGHAYLHGYGTAQNYSEARQWLGRAADLGDTIAFNTLGLMHREGQGVPIDYVQAARWFEKAAMLGHMSAKFFLGYLYSEGRGVRQNYSTAMSWFKKAADDGHPESVFFIGTYHEEGLGVPVDYAEARRWYERAARMNESSAMFALGKLYVRGRGVSPNVDQATAWFERAAALGHEEAKKMLAVGRAAATRP